MGETRYRRGLETVRKLDERNAALNALYLAKEVFAERDAKGLS